MIDENFTKKDPADLDVITGIFLEDEVNDFLSSAEVQKIQVKVDTLLMGLEEQIRQYRFNERMPRMEAKFDIVASIIPKMKNTYPAYAAQLEEKLAIFDNNPEELVVV